MPRYRVEVTGALLDPRLRTESALTHLFLVSASSPGQAEVAGMQLFGGEAGRRRCVVLPGQTVRVVADRD
jgi:hypothetical protein